MDQEIIELNHEECVVWDYADRQDFEMGNIEELAEDIKKNGQIQPIIVREKGYKYEVIAGQRRLRACKMLNTSVQAVIRNIDDTDALFVQRSENLKQNISPYSRARCYGKILKDKKITQAANSKLKCNKQVLGPYLLFLFSFFVKNFDILAVKDLVEKRLILANILFLIPGITERRLENNASKPTLATLAGEILVFMP